MNERYRLLTIPPPPGAPAVEFTAWLRVENEARDAQHTRAAGAFDARFRRALRSAKVA